MEAVEIVLVHVHDYKVAEYTFPDAEELEAGVLPEVSAKLVCSRCEDEQTVTATVVEAKVVEPTCVEAGESTFTASVEGYEDAEGVVSTKTYTIKALGHKLADAQSYKWVEDEEGNPAVEVYTTCTVCGEKLTETLVPEKAYVEGQEPTCTEGGKVRYSVNSNGINTYKDVDVKALGHNIVTHDETPSTCVEKGWKRASQSSLSEGQVRKYGQCSTCGKYLQVVLDEATGEVIRYMIVDESVARKDLDTEVTGHDYKVSIDWVEVKDAQGNVIGYDVLKTQEATLECTREGCASANASVWTPDGIVSGTNVIKKKLDNVNMKLEGNCTDANGATAKYTASVVLDNGETFTETKTIKVSGHVNGDYSITSVEVDGKQVHQHAPVCMYCHQVTGEYVNCTPSVFTADNITAEGHTGKCVCGYEFTEVEPHTLVDSGRTGDIYVDGYLHHGTIMKCSVCGYETIGTDHVIKATEAGHYCEKCGTAETAEPHTYMEWTKKSGTYTSNCSVCGHKTTGSYYEAVKNIPEWANNGSGYVTVTYESGETCVLNSDIKEIPEGLRLVFKSGSKLDINTDLTVNGVIDLESGAIHNFGNHTVAVNSDVKGAEIKGVENVAEQVNTQKSFEEALDNKVEEIVVNTNVELKEDLSEETEVKGIKVNKNVTLKVTGKLPASDLKITGEGTVDLANKNPEYNGENLQNAVTAGANDVKLSTNADLDNKLSLDGVTELNINAEGATVTNNNPTEEEDFITVKANQKVTVTGGTFKSTDATADACTEFMVHESGNLKLDSVVIEAGKNQYGAGLQGNSGKLEINNSTIKSDKYACVATNGTATTGGTMILNKVTMESTTNEIGDGDTVLYLPGKADVTLKECTLIGHHAGIQMLQGSLTVDDKTKITVDTDALTAWPTRPEEDAEKYGDKVDFAGGTKTICAKGQLVVIADDGYGETGDTLTLNLNDTTFTKNVVVLESEESNHSEVKNISFTGISAEKVKFFTKTKTDTEKTNVTVNRVKVEVSNKEA